LQTSIRKHGPAFGANAVSKLEVKQECAESEGADMNTVLLTSQIVCYGVSIVSASFNIARFVRQQRSKSKRKLRIARAHVTD
jgi:hypothetical protein